MSQDLASNQKAKVSSIRTNQILALVVFLLVVYLSLTTRRPLFNEFDFLYEFARATLIFSGAGFLTVYAALNLSKFAIAKMFGLASVVGIASINLFVAGTQSLNTSYQAVTAIVGLLSIFVVLWDRIEEGISTRVQSAKSPSGNLHLGSLGIVFFGGRISSLEPISNIVSGKLQRASMKTSRFEYAAGMIFWSIVGGGIAGLLGSWIVPLLGVYPFTPLITVGLTALGGLSVFAGFILYPLYRSGVIKKKIDGNLAYTTNYLRILTASGATTEKVFESLGSVEDVYGVRESTRRMIRSIQLLGDDVFKAMDQETQINPSPRFGEVLQGFVATARSGGDLANYFATVSKKQIDETRHDIRKVIDNLALAGEIYISGLVALPIVLVTILTISGLFGGEIFVGFSAALLLQLIVYFMIPILAVSVLLMIDALAPRSDS